MGFCVSDPQASVSVYWVSQRPEEGQILQKLRNLCPVSREKETLKSLGKKKEDSSGQQTTESKRKNRERPRREKRMVQDPTCRVSPHSDWSLGSETPRVGADRVLWLHLPTRSQA